MMVMTMEMMMMIPMKFGSMTVTMAMISPLREGISPVDFSLPVSFSLSVFFASWRRRNIYSMIPRVLGFWGDEVREGAPGGAARG